MNELILMSEQERQLFFEQSSAEKGFSEVVIEKDFWVCVVLRELFNLPDVGQYLTFKGGTSLSKGFSIIDRFSEDIDIVINRGFLGFEGELGSKKRKRLMKVCKETVASTISPKLKTALERLIPKDQKWELVPASIEEDPDEQTLLLHYPRSELAESEYVRSVVKIEMGARSDVEPHIDTDIRPYVGDLPALKADTNYTFNARVLHPRRTLWEKLCAVHEMNCSPQGPRAGNSRHLYDIVCLLKHGYGSDWELNSQMLADVVKHRRVFFKRKNVDYDDVQAGRLLITPTESAINLWRDDYLKTRDSMFAIKPFSFEVLVNELLEFADDMKRELG